MGRFEGLSGLVHKATLGILSQQSVDCDLITSPAFQKYGSAL